MYRRINRYDYNSIERYRDDYVRREQRMNSEGDYDMVSVIVPTTYQRHKYLPRIIDCFKNQTYKNKELIIYDTDSDNKYVIEESRNIRYFHNKEKVSIGEKRNFMATHAKGKYICHFDDDDYYFPLYIETMLTELGDFSFIKLASYTLYNTVTNEFKYYSLHNVKKLKPFPHIYGYGFTYFYEKDWILNFPMEDINFKEDGNWLKNVMNNGINYKYISEENFPLVIHTLHNNNTSNHIYNGNVPWDENYLLSVLYNQNEIVEGYSNKFNTYVLMYGYNYEKQLAEFLTYYLYILEFDYVIFVEDFKTKEDYEENSIMKNICSFFGERVIYDYLIRENIKKISINHRDKFQVYITKYWSTKLKESINDLSNTWLLYVNGDEFLNLNGISINTFLNKYSEDYKGISFLQHIFGTNGIEEHKYDSLLIDTHRKSVPSVNWYSKTHYENTGNKWPQNVVAGSRKGFKTMYRLDSINRGWIHRIMHLDNITFDPKIEVANINHYMIIDKKSISEHHYSISKGHDNRKHTRINSNIDLNKEGGEYTDVWKESNEIRSNPSYIQAIDYLSVLYNQNEIVEGYKNNEEEDNNEYYKGYVNGQRYVFIHIGKSGGTSVKKTLKKILNIDFIHMQKVEYEPNTKYIIWLRDPLTRFVSAYNFAHNFINKYKNNVVNIEGQRFIDLVNYFESANNLAENIYTDEFAYELMTYSNYDRCRNTNCAQHVNHISKGIAYYLNDGKFIENHHKDIIFVGTLENIENDLNKLQKLLGITQLKKIKTQTWDNIKTNKSKYLSPLAKQNLKKFYELDYYCIQLLVQYGLIDYNKVESYFN